MLDIKDIQENLERYKKGARDKHYPPELFDELVGLYEKSKPLRIEVESLLADRNRISKSIPKLAPAERESAIAEVAKIKASLDGKQSQLKAEEAELQQKMLEAPAPSRADVPVGKDDSENVELKKVGELPSFDFKPKSHIELGEKMGILDFERGVKLAGSRSYVIKGEGAVLEQAVLRFTYDLLLGRGYEPLSIPVLVTEEAMEGTGYFPVGRDQAYFVEKDELALIGTGEVSLTSYHRGEILKQADLPKRMFTSSSCFRREAGSYGKDTKGLYRVHQFQKVEQVILAPACESTSEKLHAELLQNSEDVLQALELPYRVVYVCTGDLGQGQVRKHDIETWMPSRDGYGETHSCSTFHDFQARRLKMRYKDASGQKNTCYTLNNTAIASPRVLIALLENHQTKDGKVRIPKALQSYMHGKTEIG